MPPRRTPILAAALLALAGCHEAPAPAPTTNPDYPVTLLFEKDGIKVYRFFDNGSFHYFASAGSTVATDAMGRVSPSREVPTVTAPRPQP